MRRSALRRAAPLLACALAVLLLAFPVRAGAAPDEDRKPVALIADQVTYDTETGKVVATGNVEVYYGQRTLTADRIVYDERTGRISSKGDITVRDPSGTTVYADVAELGADLQSGLVRGAQMVIGGDVKLAAVELRRVNDRYNALLKGVYSPCPVCSKDPTPLWAIRAERVIHDEVEKVIHYENATFLVLGVPVAWLPYFQHPDPTVERATGFLIPSVLSSSTYGYAIKVPYYWVIDPYSDLTITPFITLDDGPLLDLEYRRKFESGRVRFAGSLTWDDYEDGKAGFHGYIDTDGLFDIGAGVDAGWNITATTDDGFLRRYDYDYPDRLLSELFVRRYRRNDFFEVSALRFQSLRENEPADQIPFALPYMEARWEVADPVLGGEFGFFTSGYALGREDGRDAARLSLGVDWEREEILPFGLSVTGFASVRGDVYGMRDDPGAGDDTTARLAGQAGVTLRYPLIWNAPNGVSHIIEPVVQAIAAPYGINDSDIPNEDSIVSEFDDLNVIDRNHFSGIDEFEEGPRLNLLLRYDRVVEEGVRFDASVGRVFRLEDIDGFSAGSGLRDISSDWVASWQASWDPYLVLRHRMRIADDMSVAQMELFGAVNIAPVELSGTYSFIEADPAIDAPEDREEIRTGAGLRLNRNWSISGVLQRDLEEDEFVLLGGKVTWENECTEIGFFVRREFTETEDAPASTSFGLTVKLRTLGASDFGDYDAGAPGLFGSGGISCG